MEFKEWFLNRKSQNELYYLNNFDLEVVKETEKAIKVNADRYSFWIPKSAIMSEEQEQEQSKKNYERMERNFSRQENLVKWCKDNGLTARVNSKIKTLIKKINESGKWNSEVDRILEK